MSLNSFFEDDDDDFFAEALESISAVESSFSESLSCSISRDDLSKENVSNSNIPALWANETANTQSAHATQSYMTTAHKNEENSPLIISSQAKSTPVDNDKSIMGPVESTHVGRSINNRFTPGYIPKERKRTFPEFLAKKRRISSDCNTIPIENIISSQYSAEGLFHCLSWKKLQEDVSSHSRFQTIVKDFSIHRIYNDTAKMKLPKHAIVPIICVSIKEPDAKEPMPMLMDDTGEMKVNFDKDLLHKDTMQPGTALVLKKVIVMCNVMILKTSNLVSIYVKDGSVLHLKDWNELLNNEEPLNKISQVTPRRQCIPETLKTLHKSPILQEMQHSHNSSYLVPGDAIISTPLFKNDMDEFDDLLGNIDETSFLEEF